MVNDAWRLVPDAPHHYACDGQWWDKYYDDVKAGFLGESYTIDDVDESINPDRKYDLIRLKSKHGPSLGKTILHYGLNGGGNSGYQAVNLAYQKGARTIVLLGFDMFGNHFFGQHPSGLSNHSPFKEFIKSFQTIDTETLGIEIINCTSRTALTCFPRANLDSVLSLAPDRV